MHKHVSHASKRGLLTTLVVLVLVHLGSDTALAQSALRWKLKKDDHLAVNYVQQTSTKTIVNTRPILMTITMTVDFDWQVEDVSQTGEITIAQTFTRLQFEMDAGDTGRLKYDSAANRPVTSATRTIAESSKLLLAAKTIVKMDERGQVVATELVGDTAAQLEQADDAIKRLLSAEGIGEMLGQAAAPLPEKSITNGDTWKSERKATTPLGTINQVTTYTSKGTTDVDGKSVESIGIAATFNIEKSASKTRIKEQSLTGEMLFDNEAGRLVSSKLTQTLQTEKSYRDKLVRVTAKTETSLSVKNAGDE